MQIAGYIIAAVGFYLGLTAVICAFLGAHRDRQLRKNAAYRAMQDDCWLSEVVNERAAFHADRNGL